MAIITKQLDVDVLTLAKRRVQNTFSNGVPIYLSISGGKDSIVLCDLVYKEILKGNISPRLLEVVFVDEEAMHDEVIRIVEDWRDKFMKVGAKFTWFCIEAKHFNCFNQLSNDESFIMWDRYAKDTWVRPMPEYAVTQHPLLRPRQETYQDFLTKYCSDGLSLTGVRVAESYQRRQGISAMFTRDGDHTTGDAKVSIIYDWSDSDIWLYIQNEKLDFPMTYMNLYQIGTARNKMRLSQFFSIDTAQSLVSLSEYDPTLMERITKREPNAYLAMMYWDTEMFRRSSKGRKNSEKDKVEEKDYHAELINMFDNMDTYFTTPTARKVAISYKRWYMRNIGNMSDKVYKMMYEALVAGDPKQRVLRSLGAIATEERRNVLGTEEEITGWK